MSGLENWKPDVAVLLPCFNEAATIGAIVSQFRAALPDARIYVYDNNSTDGTALHAMLAGAIVEREPRQGKGHVVRRMFADIEADIYVMTDGNGTYAPEDAERLIRTLITEQADMVVGTRQGIPVDAGRNGHAMGIRMFNRLYTYLFGKDFSENLSGYRAFSRRFVKSFPAVSADFEIATEMSMHATRMKLPVSELELAYGRRPEDAIQALDVQGRAVDPVDVRVVDEEDEALRQHRIHFDARQERLHGTGGRRMYRDRPPATPGRRGPFDDADDSIPQPDGLGDPRLRRPLARQTAADSGYDAQRLLQPGPSWRDLGGRDQADAPAVGVLRRFMNKLIRFGIVGGTGFAVDAAVLWILLRFTSVGPLPARIAAIALAMTTTWLLNRSFTFGASQRSVVVEGFRYGAVALTTAAVNYAIYASLLLSMPHLNPMAALVFASAGAMAFSFFGYARFVFRR